ncbi:MAG: hypothetical protein AB7F32_11900 [Victivallaceae bacterium]
MSDFKFISAEIPRSGEEFVSENGKWSLAIKKSFGNKKAVFLNNKATCMMYVCGSFFCEEQNFDQEAAIIEAAKSLIAESEKAVYALLAQIEDIKNEFNIR